MIDVFIPVEDLPESHDFKTISIEYKLGDSTKESEGIVLSFSEPTVKVEMNVLAAVGKNAMAYNYELAKATMVKVNGKTFAVQELADDEPSKVFEQIGHRARVVVLSKIGQNGTPSEKAVEVLHLPFQIKA